MKYKHVRVDNTTTVAQINKMGGGGDKVKPPVTCNTTVVGLLSTEHDHSYCRTLTRGAECNSRQGIESIPRFEQLGVKQTNISPNRRALGSHRSRSVCGQIDRTETQICELETRSRSNSGRCSDVKLGSNSGYAFPPFCLISRCLAKIMKDQASLIVVTPVWPNQPWYSQILEMLIDQPILLPPMRELLMSPQGEMHSLLITGQLVLAAWNLSGNGLKQKGFQKNLLTSYSNHAGMAPKWLTQAPGKNVL